MEKEFSKTKIIIATVVGLSFLAMVALFIVAVIQKPVSQIQDVSRQEVIPASTIQPTDKDEKQNSQAEDKIEFEDPGDDEIGSQVKELDNMVNDILPSEYDESELSEDVIESEAQ